MEDRARTMNENSPLLPRERSRSRTKKPIEILSGNTFCFSAWLFGLLCGISVCIIAWLILVFSGGGIWPFTVPSKPQVASSSSIASNFSWSQITPTTDLRFHSCYAGFECARLSVPLDWYNTTASNPNPINVSIALTRLPATVARTDPSYAGPLLVNPGGPGGSGVWWALARGAAIRAAADSPGRRRFDVVGFDPRGVNHSAPAAACFPGDWERQNWEVEGRGAGLPRANESFGVLWERGRALAESCGEAIGGFGPYAGTAEVVGDMVAMVEALGEEREREVRRLVEGWERGVEREEVVEQARWRRGEEKLWYWGVSYGTVLGATFAAMHPDRVGRFVLDGVVDAEKYYKGDDIPTLVDADKVLEGFFTSCHAAGPENCPAYSTEGPEGVRALWDSVKSNLLVSSVAVPAHGSFPPDVVTYSDFMDVVRRGIYFPLDAFGSIAQILAELSTGNGTSLAEWKQQTRSVYCPSSECKSDGPWSESCHRHDVYADSEATPLVWCMDRWKGLRKTYDESWQHWQEVRNVSEALGDWWSTIMATCRDWSIEPGWTFDGPVAGITSHPILWIGNTHDPVTPLRDAFKSAERFPGSVVLQQDCDGHATLAAPSICTAKHLKRFFLTGELPQPGTICEVDQHPFEKGNEVLAARFADRPDRNLFLALQGLAETPATSFFQSRVLALGNKGQEPAGIE